MQPDLCVTGLCCCCTHSGLNEFSDSAERVSVKYNPRMLITDSQARSLMVTALGLDRRPRRSVRKQDVLTAIRHMAALQIDTIHVVARSPYLTLFSRLGKYNPVWLDELLAEGRLFEYWVHEASLVPIEDYRLFRHRMLARETKSWRYSQKWADENAAVIERVRKALRDRGPLRSADFERTDGKRGGWWSGWKDEKIALENMFGTGEVMVAARHNFQRVYDLRERVLPDWDDSCLSSPDLIARELVLKASRSMGITTARWIGDYFRSNKVETAELARTLADEGRLLKVQVGGWRDEAYVHPDNAVLLKRAAAGKLVMELTTLLSPFDPLIWDRARTLATFNFDYRLECYTPASKRRYGYFTLPILRRGNLIGRLDPKAHRKEGIFEVKALHLEPGVTPGEDLVADLATSLRDCAAWHNTPKVVVRKANPSRLLNALKTALAKTET